jgi:hypothetical protein
MPACARTQFCRRECGSASNSTASTPPQRRQISSMDRYWILQAMAGPKCAHHFTYTTQPKP